MTLCLKMSHSIIRCCNPAFMNKHESGSLGMARCFNVQGNKWSNLTNFQTTGWLVRPFFGDNQCASFSAPSPPYFLRMLSYTLLNFYFLFQLTL